MDKIKALWNNPKARWGIIGGAVALLVIIGVVIALCVGGNNAKGAPITDCVVTVKTEGGMVLENIGVEVYADASKQDMVGYAKTDAEGKAAIDGEVPAGSVAVLVGVPAGYVVEETYTITQADTQIVLKTEPIVHDEWQQFATIAPKDQIVNGAKPTEEQKELCQAKTTAATHRARSALF